MAQELVSPLLIDTHAHLFFDHFKDDLNRVKQNAVKNGVGKIINVGINEETSRTVVEMAGEESIFFAAIGIHPNDCHKTSDDYLKTLRELAKNRKVVAIGEIGLDYYWDRAPKKTQHEKFQAQLDLARELGLPVVIHNRDAWEDSIAILKNESNHGNRGVFHCFSGDRRWLKQVLDLDFFVSFTGVVTFKNSNAIELVERYVPLNKLLLETDSPFMAPIPFRGKRCEPAFVKIIAERIAQAKKVSLSELAEITTANAKSLFEIS